MLMTIYFFNGRFITNCKILLVLLFYLECNIQSEMNSPTGSPQRDSFKKSRNTVYVFRNLVFENTSQSNGITYLSRRYTAHGVLKPHSAQQVSGVSEWPWNTHNEYLTLGNSNRREGIFV
jgi:hypothetical protein